MTELSLFHFKVKNTRKFNKWQSNTKNQTNESIQITQYDFHLFVFFFFVSSEKFRWMKKREHQRESSVVHIVMTVIRLPIQCALDYFPHVWAPPVSIVTNYAAWIWWKTTIYHVEKKAHAFYWNRKWNRAFKWMRQRTHHVRVMKTIAKIMPKKNILIMMMIDIFIIGEFFILFHKGKNRHKPSHFSPFEYISFICTQLQQLNRTHSNTRMPCDISFFGCRLSTASSKWLMKILRPRMHGTTIRDDF